METKEITFTDFELCDDLIESYTQNPDIGFLDLSLKDRIEDFPVGTLLKVNKKIGSPIKIISVEEVDDEMVSSMIGK